MQCIVNHAAYLARHAPVSCIHLVPQQLVCWDAHPAHSCRRLDGHLVVSGYCRAVRATCGIVRDTVLAGCVCEVCCGHEGLRCH